MIISIVLYVVKNGIKTSLIKIPKVSEFVSYLELTKQRYKCKNFIDEYSNKIKSIAKQEFMKYIFLTKDFEKLKDL